MVQLAQFAAVAQVFGNLGKQAGRTDDQPKAQRQVGDQIRQRRKTAGFTVHAVTLHHLPQAPDNTKQQHQPDAKSGQRMAGECLDRFAQGGRIKFHGDHSKISLKIQFDTSRFTVFRVLRIVERLHE